MPESNRNIRDRLRRIPAGWWKAGAILVVVVAAVATAGLWGPGLRDLMTGKPAAADDATETDDEHNAGDESDLIELSDAAKRNIGLKLGTVSPRSYTKSMTVPAIVVHRPGRTRFSISAPMTGIVTDIAVVHGQAVWSDALLFKLRLTHQDLVRVQTEFLRTLGQRDVEVAEIKRLKKFVGRGVPGQVVLEKEYEREKLNALLRAQREALRLHGLSESQVEAIEESRKLRHNVTVTVPRLHLDQSLHFEYEPDEHRHPKPSKSGDSKPSRHQSRRQRFIVEQLPVHVGQAVKAGETLCVLADYGELFLEGRAFEQDADALVRTNLVTVTASASAGAGLAVDAKRPDRTVTAIAESQPGHEEKIENLQLAYVDNEIDVSSRALHFFVSLPNTIVNEEMRNGRAYITWKYRPGQRMQIRVPVETWENVIVLPAEAVARDGIEAYVFVQNGDALERRPVQVRYRDRFDVVVEPGNWIVMGVEKVALNAAHQLLVAIKIKAGGGGGHHHHH